LIQDYHGGADGRVWWLICSNSGKLGVMKLSKERTYEDEMIRWNNIWKCNTFTCKIFERVNALIMPFAFHGYCKEKRVTFRGLNHWTNGHSSVNDILYSEVSAEFDRGCLSSYFDEPFKAAEEAIREMANQGYIHLDLHWRHVALLPYYIIVNKKTQKKLWKVRPILIDLTRCELHSEADGIDQIVADGLQRLQSELEDSS
jgi:hypothetical protein